MKRGSIMGSNKAEWSDYKKKSRLPQRVKSFKFSPSFTERTLANEFFLCSWLPFGLGLSLWGCCLQWPWLIEVTLMAVLEAKATLFRNSLSWQVVTSMRNSNSKQSVISGRRSVVSAFSLFLLHFYVRKIMANFAEAMIAKLVLHLSFLFFYRKTSNWASRNFEIQFMR